MKYDIEQKKKTYLVEVEWTVKHYVRIDEIDHIEASIKAMQVPLIIVGHDNIEADRPTGITEIIDIED